MAVEIRMPQIASDMSEADLLSWLAAPGDAVVAGDVLLEIETDKSTVEIEAPANGTLVEILVPAGSQSVKVGELLGRIEADEASSDDTARPPQGKPSPAEAAAAAPELAPTDASPGDRESAMPVPPAEPIDASPPDEGVSATALARRIADQAGLDLGSVEGSGARGRVTRDDVERRLAGPVTAASDRVPATGRAAEQRKPLSRTSRITAERLSAAEREISHFDLSVDCRVDALMTVREEINEPNGAQRISVNDLVVRACALALREVPDANASWDGDAIVRHDAIDVGVAVATEGGLVTAVVRDADRKGLAALSGELCDLAERARAGRLEPNEHQGGGISVSNLGMYGIDRVSPIIDPPQSCVVGVGAARPAPVVAGGEVVPGTLLTLTLSADHRVVDGAVGATLLAAIARRLENPLEMIL